MGQQGHSLPPRHLGKARRAERADDGVPVRPGSEDRRLRQSLGPGRRDRPRARGSLGWRGGGQRPGGVLIVGARAAPRPAGTEARLAGFTELAATAIANAEARAALTASRARIVSTADATRRRIERNLHDGAQQRLVSLALDLRAAQANAPPGAGQLVQELDGVAAGLEGV